MTSHEHETAAGLAAGVTLVRRPLMEDSYLVDRSTGRIARINPVGTLALSALLSTAGTDACVIEYEAFVLRAKGSDRPADLLMTATGSAEECLVLLSELARAGWLSPHATDLA